jgi:hypothetical protein
VTTPNGRRGLTVLVLWACCGAIWAYQAWWCDSYRRNHPACEAGRTVYLDRTAGTEAPFQVRSREITVNGWGRYESLQVTALPAQLPRPEWRVMSEEGTKWGDRIAVDRGGHDYPHPAELGLRFAEDWAGRSGTLKVRYTLSYPDSALDAPIGTALPKEGFVDAKSRGVVEIPFGIYGPEEIRTFRAYNTFYTWTTRAGLALLAVGAAYTLYALSLLADGRD